MESQNLLACISIKIATPSYLIRCHGLSDALTFENSLPFQRVPEPKDPSKNSNDTNPNPSMRKMSITPFK
jgi:hypothetical protein